jgi:hypothetical protein
MALTLEQPDLVLGLRPSASAPTVARRVLAHVGRRSPDLHDAIELIVSNVVTRACEMRPAASERIGLRGWRHDTVVRVEVEYASSEPAPVPSRERWPDEDIELLEALADRWGIDRPSPVSTMVWFEIDRPSP